MRFRELMNLASSCRQCPHMMFGRTFLNEHNGSLDAEIMFIGEATNVGSDDLLPKPFWDSPSGDNLNALLSFVNLPRDDVFITNTVLHTPVGRKGQMRYTTEKEQSNCSSFLSHQIRIVNPKILVTLGARALSGLSILYDNLKGLELRYNVANVIRLKDGRYLIPLYHPSPNVIMTWRPMKQQVEDYKSITTLLEKLNKESNNVV